MEQCSKWCSRTLQKYFFGLKVANFRCIWKWLYLVGSFFEPFHCFLTILLNSMTMKMLQTHSTRDLRTTIPRKPVIKSSLIPRLDAGQCHIQDVRNLHRFIISFEQLASVEPWYTSDYRELCYWMTSFEWHLYYQR